MKGLTAKVFRTYNASITFQEQLLLLTPKTASVQEKLNAYNKANRMVAILCNHQKSVSKNHSVSMEKMNDKVRLFCVFLSFIVLIGHSSRTQLRAIKYERMKHRHILFGLDPKYKKKKEYKDDESDLDEEWIVQHEESLKEKEIDRAKKKFAKDNEKLEAEGEKPKDESVLNERLEEIEAEFERLEGERGTRTATLKRAKPAEKIEEAIEKLNERIKTHKLQMIDREEGKEVALGTRCVMQFFDFSSYVDIHPCAVKSTISILGQFWSCYSRSSLTGHFCRITQAWCRTHDVPIEKIFSKALLTKCKLVTYPSHSPPDLVPQFHGPWKWMAIGNFKFVLYLFHI